MKRSAFASFVTAAVLALGAVPALAQESRPSGASGSQAGSRPSGGSEGSGTAVSRPSGGGGGGSSSGSSAGASSAGSSSSSGSSGMSMPSSGGGSDFVRSRPSAPERRGGDYAMPRAGNGGNYVGRAGASRPSSSVPGADAASDQRRAVPAYSRPREGRPVVGEAAERRNAPGGPITNPPSVIYYGYPYFDSYYGYPNRYSYGYGYGPWYGGYGFGLGYFYDPFGYYGYYSPYNDDYGYSSGYGSGRYEYGYGRPTGQIRLKVNPKHGQVYVDGYFAGEVDSFDGMFQRLAIEAGAHKVEIRAEGFEPVVFDVMVTPGETVTYKGELKPIR